MALRRPNIEPVIKIPLFDLDIHWYVNNVLNATMKLDIIFMNKKSYNPVRSYTKLLLRRNQHSTVKNIAWRQQWRQHGKTLWLDLRVRNKTCLKKTRNVAPPLKNYVTFKYGAEKIR